MSGEVKTGGAGGASGASEADGARTFLSAALSEPQAASACGLGVDILPAATVGWKRSVRVALAGAMLLALAHYAFGEWVYHPRLALWWEPLFWQSMPWVAAVPVLVWLAWLIISFGRVNAAWPVLAMFAAAFAGDWVWLLIWRYTAVLGVRISPDYWYWWTRWLPTVLAVGNVTVAWDWWRQARNRAALRRKDRSSRGNEALNSARTAPLPADLSLVTSAATRSRGLFELALRAGMLLGIGAAILFALVHFALPRLPVTDFTLDTAGELLVPARWSGDFEYVVQSAPCRGKRLGVLLDHVELANRQRGQFYKELDVASFQQWVLSPVVDSLPVAELDWRRVLWEAFYPLVRQERDPANAARIVGGALREDVGISPEFPYRVGVETIWTQHMTDETGFERVYVAALRSVGIAARLDGGKHAEFLANGAWHSAPRPQSP